eukprot:CAMPEP_0195508044 /NCGR_PEP_ID=MMETSP0794_2-20130614/1350_1 /TAXON_ID=515487 /ORGANISM="Stephanopyxis turris, Strain CCMP 815" /LENGTH=1053 /DNA_ID=CAMNT_0040634899 /DNA_START=48 /DNA_END=3209 /DNA_ORIENTATION=+
MTEPSSESSTSPPLQPPRRVAIIGGGISGLSAAWHLLQNQSKSNLTTIDIFESTNQLGGHAHTITIHPDGDDKAVDVDVGFMVFNNENYPNMTAWFQELGVESEDSDMSLSVSLDSHTKGGTEMEWSSTGLNGMFANKAQLFRPSFYKFLRDMVRFNAEAADVLLLAKDDPRRHITTGQYLRNEGYSEAFSTHYLLPMMAALWSASLEDVLQFPIEQLVGFLCNHKMLQVFDRPVWKTVANRSKSYTSKMTKLLGERAHISTPILSVVKQQTQESIPEYELFTDSNKSVGLFDEVVFACHPPTAHSMLQKGNNATSGEKMQQHDGNMMEILSNIEYADNVMYLHSDPSLMPKRKAAWSSWNCLGKSSLLATHHDSSAKDKSGEAMEGGESGFGNRVASDDDAEDSTSSARMKAVFVTYYLNKLQNLKTSTGVFVSLNPHWTPDPKLVYEKLTMAHPQFTPHTLRARDELEEKFQGKDGLWFCGAWSGYGFHEDGCRSGFKVASTMIDTAVPWAANKGDSGSLVLQPPNLAKSTSARNKKGIFKYIYNALCHTLPVAVCKRIICGFLKSCITTGSLQLKMNDGSLIKFGNGGDCVGCDKEPVTLRIFDDWFFVKVALEYDLGLARSYMSGHFTVEPLPSPSQYDQVIRPPSTRDETTPILGDPVGLTRLFLLFIGNRDDPTAIASPRKSARNHTYSSALSNASGLLISKIGSFCNFLIYKLYMDNSERGGSLKNIHAHYDLSNDLFTSFLDKETLMYSSAIYDAVKAPSGQRGMVFRGSLEEAQWRKLDTLLDRAQIQPGQQMLDIGFGWGGLSLHAARKYGCKVTGITLSVEQKALAEERVAKEGLGHLITFEVVDYRTFARKKENRGKFDRVLSCEMIEAVGHEHLGEFFWAVEQVLSHDGILVMEAITTPEARYETYRRSTDFINSIIFPGSCCPSLHALVEASYQQSTLTLEHIDNIGLHYARTLAEWRRRFNASESLVRKLGFDDVFLRVWNYYLTYCEAGFHSQTENCLILVFSRPGCNALVPLCETRCVTQLNSLTDEEVKNWVGEE